MDKAADVYSQIAEKIIAQQQNIIGPVAIEQANMVNGLNVEWGKEHHVAVSGNGKAVIDALVEQYKQLFGQISVEVCKEAAPSLVAQLPPAERPKSLA